jgi:hypothetical protein
LPLEDFRCLHGRDQVGSSARSPDFPRLDLPYDFIHQPDPVARRRGSLRHHRYAAPVPDRGSATLSNLCIPRTGHSERRTLFGETSAIVAEKTRAALDAGLRIILCVGETLAEREAGRTQQVVEEQLQAVVSRLSPEDWRFVPWNVCLYLTRGVNFNTLAQPHRHRVRARLGNRHRKSRHLRTGPGGAR